MLFTRKRKLDADLNKKLSSLFASDCSTETYWLPELINKDVFDHEYRKEWKIHMLRKNLENIKNAKTSKYRFIFYSPKMITSVFNLCKILKQPPDVRYLAIDILDRFLVRHFFAVAETFQMMENTIESDWDGILVRMANQLLLRVLSCIQIAAKQCSTCSIITVQTIQEVMKYLKHPNFYSKRNIIKSEARICKTLNFSISNGTPLIYIELLVEDLKDDKFFNNKQHSIYNFFITCINVLDIAIIHHEKIYFAVAITCKLDVSSSREVFQALKGDFMIFAASVVFAASVLLGIKSVFTNYLFEDLKSSWADYHQKQKIIRLGKEILHIISSLFNKKTA